MQVFIIIITLKPAALLNKTNSFLILHKHVVSSFQRPFITAVLLFIERFYDTHEYTVSRMQFFNVILGGMYSYHYFLEGCVTVFTGKLPLK